MVFMKIKSLIAIILLFWSFNLTSFPLDINELSIPNLDSVGLNPAMSDQLDALVDDFIDRGILQGAVIAVSRNNVPVYFAAHGWANEISKIKMRKDSMFQMASSSKPVLGVATMIASERGLLNIQDPVSKYLPEFAGMKVAVLKEPSDIDISPLGVFPASDEDVGFFSKLTSKLMTFAFDGYYFGEIPPHRFVEQKEPLTIHHLLTHTAGLGTDGLGEALSGWDYLNKGKKNGAFKEGVTLASITEDAQKGYLDFQPGSRWSYAKSVGLDVVARIIEITSGQPFDEFVRENIFDPLDMKDTDWNIPEEKLNRLVFIREGGTDGGKPKPTKWFSGSHSLISTARDYLHFEQMMTNGGQLAGVRILSESSVIKMSTNQVGDLYSKMEKNKSGAEGMGYTVSVTLDPDKTDRKRGKGAFGWVGIVGTHTWADPKNGLAVVIMVQQPTKEFPEEVSQIIFNAIKRD